MFPYQDAGHLEGRHHVAGVHPDDPEAPGLELGDDLPGKDELLEFAGGAEVVEDDRNLLAGTQLKFSRRI